jgi:hypothetical protein
MTTQSQFPVLGFAEALAGLTALILAAACSLTEQHNRSLEAHFRDNQAQLNKSETLAVLNGNLVRLVGKVAIDRHDAALSDLLARNGIKLQEPAKAK